MRAASCSQSKVLPASAWALPLIAALLLACPLPRAQGLRLQPSPTPSVWQARLQLSSVHDDERLGADARRGARLLSANLLGDYYLTGSGLGGDTRGGLRATGGLMLGSPSLAQSSAGLALGRQASLGPYLFAGQRSLGLLGHSLDREPSMTASYLGLGYSSYSLRGGWGFSADLGLLANANAVRLGNSLSLDSALRYQPVLQLGLSYSY